MGICRNTESLPRELRAYHQFHNGETILVCGCGSSLSQIVSPERYITIGVNDVGRLFQPDYLVVLNPRQQFRNGRFRYVQESRARSLFTQLELGIRHPNIVRIRLGKYAGVHGSDPSVLHYARNSPYLAMCLAIHMGAKRIGLIGVDFTDHHFFGVTGKHPLADEFAQIDREYTGLYQACRQQGIEVLNLSAASRLSAIPKITPREFAERAVLPSENRHSSRKIFFVNYKFLSCGEVFRDGLKNAADELGLSHELAYWDDVDLPGKVQRFSPDLMFVVHGRKFGQRWRGAIKGHPSAVWLLDEPYEVDDTSRFSSSFDKTFVNDSSTLGRHRNSQYLPVCYDPKHYFYLPAASRKYEVGFIGGYNPVREEFLDALAQRGLLSYVVGGPWTRPSLKRLALSPNIPAQQTADLYRDTKIILNVFRTVHHFNRHAVAPTSLNPRVYEAAACGAVIVSQPRAELASICPELPIFQRVEDLGALIEGLLQQPDRRDEIRRMCTARLASHTFAHRLQTCLNATIAIDDKEASVSLPSTHIAPTVEIPLPDLSFAADWEKCGAVAQFARDGTLTLDKTSDLRPGGEEGLVSRVAHQNVTLSFELWMEPGATFVAKLHLQQPRNQSSNSYHVYCDGRQTYFARHHCVFRTLSLPASEWTKVHIAHVDGLSVIRINGAIACAVRDRALSNGHCFVGTKGGSVRLRDLRISSATQDDVAKAAPVAGHSFLYQGALAGAPLVSIVTTVYNRVPSLERCLRSVNALHFQNYEQIVVSDSPPGDVVEQIRSLTECYDRGVERRIFANAQTRANDWGITPASIGLNLARGKYICFLSDDNCYLREHFDPLVAALEADVGLGFAYSSCLYAGRITLKTSPPQPGRIDLGQPLFRKELFDLYLNGTLPFRELAWDWRMIEQFLRSGVRWKHINKTTFIFRSENYPQLFAGPR